VSMALPSVFDTTSFSAAFTKGSSREQRALATDMQMALSALQANTEKS
jgi:hypothetical protein